MARPIKKGLDYFPVDTDIFENIQVRKLKSRYKSLGFLVYFTLLCDTYKKYGYFLPLSDDYIYDLSDRMNETEETVREIIAFCLQIKLFNQQKYNTYLILTAQSIQLRYLQAHKRCKITIREEYDCISATETAVNVAETTQNTTESAHIILNNNIENIQQQQQCASVACQEEKDREEWKQSLLSDEDWQATIVRYSGKGVAVLQYIQKAMSIFEDYLRLSFKLDSIHSKKEYSQSFIGWWRYHNFNLKMEELSGGVPKNNSKVLHSANKPEQRSKIDELMETGRQATELAMKIYSAEAV